MCQRGDVGDFSSVLILRGGLEEGWSLNWNYPQLMLTLINEQFKLGVIHISSVFATGANDN